MVRAAGETLILIGASHRQAEGQVSPDGEQRLWSAPAHCVVGIGSSAGGLEALQEVRHIPSGLPISILVAQHLAPQTQEPDGRALGPGDTTRGCRGRGRGLPTVGTVHVCHPGSTS